LAPLADRTATVSACTRRVLVAWTFATALVCPPEAGASVRESTTTVGSAASARFASISPPAARVEAASTKVPTFVHFVHALKRR